MGRRSENRSPVTNTSAVTQDRRAVVDSGIGITGDQNTVNRDESINLVDSSTTSIVNNSTVTDGGLLDAIVDIYGQATDAQMSQNERDAQFGRQSLDLIGSLSNAQVDLARSTGNTAARTLEQSITASSNLLEKFGELASETTRGAVSAISQNAKAYAPPADGQNSIAKYAIIAAAVIGGAAFLGRAK